VLGGDRSNIGLGAFQQKIKKPHERLSNKILQNCNKSRSSEIILSAQSPSQKAKNMDIRLANYWPALLSWVASVVGCQVI